jgi:molybdopterin-containing oxidoreductase family iron-sulfur binding subunit
MKKLTRRQLIKLASLAGAGAILPQQIHAFNFSELLEKIPGYQKIPTKVPPPVAGIRFGMVIDLGLCIGCRRCSYGCKLENSVPDTISPPYIMVFETDPMRFTSGHPLREKFKEKNRLMYTKLRKDMIYMPVQCNHCEDPPCTKVCPTQATYKAEDGIVMVDYSKCIGCRYCMTACPYNARRFNWWEPHVPPEKVNPLVPVRPHGVVEKCTFCVHRTRLGKTTRCVEVCPNRARIFGNLNDPDSEVSKLIKAERNLRLKEGLNTGPQIWYLTRGKRKPMRWFKPLPPPENVRGVMK